MVRIGTGIPFDKINHANSAYFRLFLGYFRVISATRPTFWISARPPILHILDPPLYVEDLSKCRGWVLVLLGLGSQFTTGTIRYNGEDWWYGYDGILFDDDAKKLEINITSIKIDDGERWRDLIHLTNYFLEKYWSIDTALLLDSCPLHNPLHTVALHLSTIVIHLVHYNSHCGINVRMACRAYASYAIFLITHLFNSRILKNYGGRIETPWPKLFSSNHCIRRDDARSEWEHGLT